MPSVRIPLAGSYNLRGPIKAPSTAKDQRFIGAMFDVVQNNLTNTATVYVEKRPGLQESVAVTGASGKYGAAVYRSTAGSSRRVSVWSNTSGSRTADAVFIDTTECGALTKSGSVRSICGITDVLVNGSTYFLLQTQLNAWYLPEDLTGRTRSYTGDTSNGSAVITNIAANTTYFYVGQLLTGTGIQSDSRVLSVDSSTQVTMDKTATATNTGVAITKDHVALITDTDFPNGLSSNAYSGLIPLDGFTFVLSADAKIYNSELNNPLSWTSAAYIEPDDVTDFPIQIARQKNYIVALGRNSIEFFRNNGNPPPGSPLVRVQELMIRTGVKIARAYRDRIFLVSEDEGTNVGVYILENFGLKKISTPDIDKILAKTSSYFLDVGTINGATYLIVQDGLVASQSSAFSLMYCVDTGLWSETGFANTYCFDSNYLISALDRTGTSGKVFSFGSTIAYQDNGSAFSLILQLSRQDFGSGNRKFLKSIELIADTQASGTTTLEISTDDFATFTTIGTFDMTKAKKIIHRCGSFAGGASLRLTHSANTAWRGEALLVDYEVGAH